MGRGAREVDQSKPNRPPSYSGVWHFGGLAPLSPRDACANRRGVVAGDVTRAKCAAANAQTAQARSVEPIAVAGTRMNRIVDGAGSTASTK